MRNKILSLVLVGIIVLSLVACGTDEEETEIISSEVSVEEGISEEVTEIVTGEVTVVGKVVSVAGNMVTIQIGSYVEQEGMTEGELPEGMTEGELPEGMTEGEMSEGMTEREIPEGITEGEIPEGVTEGEIPEGITEGELPEGVTEGEIPEGMTESGMGMSASGMIEGGIEAVDMSEFIELTDETLQITIPVGTPVYSMGIEYDFTDIVEDCYITISEDESGTIVAVNILG